MAHGSSTSSLILPFFFNIDAPVGKNGANLPQDVLLVKWFLRKVAVKSAPSDFATKGSALPVDGSCNQATIDCIRAFQQFCLSKNPGTVTVDGRVSTAAGGSASYGNGVYTIADLNFNYRKLYWPTWPLLDAEPDADAIPGVSAIVYKCLYGTTPV